MPNRRVAIVGASTSDCGRVDDKTAFELNFQGTTRALADAGIEKSEVDGFMSLTGALPPVPFWIDRSMSTEKSNTCVRQVSFSAAGSA